MKKVKAFLGILLIGFLFGFFNARSQVDGPDIVEYFYSQLVEFVSKDGSINYTCVSNNTRYKYFIDKGELKLDEIKAEGNELYKGISVADDTISDIILYWNIRNIWARFKKQPIKNSIVDVVKIATGYMFGAWVAIKLKEPPCDSVIVTDKLKERNVWKKIAERSFTLFNYNNGYLIPPLGRSVRSNDFLPFEKTISNE